MNKYDFKTLYFDVEENTNVSTDFEPAISIDYVERIAENIQTLQRALGITQMIPMADGNVVKRYRTTVTKGAKQAAEGDIVPLSKVERVPLDPLILELEFYRKLTTAQALQRVGTQIALNDSDTALMKEIRKDVRDKFFALITANTATSAAGGANLQAAAAQAWGSLSVYFEDKDVTPVYFVNPLDVATYLGSAQITVQNVFGFDYVENFLGLGNAFITPQIPQGAIYATVQENLNGVYVPQGGDVADAFDMTYDETGIVGMTHSRADERASIQTLIAMGVLFFPEDASGVIKSYIGDGPNRVELDQHTAAITAAAGDSHTVALTATKVPSSASVTWASSDTSKATVSNGTVTGVAAGTATITASIEVNGVTYSDACVVTVS